MQALELAQTLQHDILHPDIEMPVLNGLESSGPSAGYLIKDDVLSKLVPRLRSVAVGEKNWLRKRLR